MSQILCSIERSVNVSQGYRVMYDSDAAQITGIVRRQTSFH